MKQGDPAPNEGAGDEPVPTSSGSAAANPDLERLDRVSSGPPYSTFTKSQKGYIVFMIALGGFFSPLSANIFFPALNALSHDLRVSNELINLSLTSYMIFQGLAPTFFGDLGDMTGRRPAYMIGFVIYIGANIGLALQRNYAALLVLRCLQSTGSSGTIALCNGVVGDISSSGERGKYMGMAQFGSMIAPAVAPILGGILTQFLGWQWLFWFLTIAAVLYLIPFIFLFPETGRNVVGNGSIPPQGWNMSAINYIVSRRHKYDNSSDPTTLTSSERQATHSALASKRPLRFPNPLTTLKIIVEKDVGVLLLYNALVYTAFYDIMASFPSLLQEIYGFNDLQVGLSFIPIGVGCSIASLIFGRLMDSNYRRLAKANGLRSDVKRGDDIRNFPIEKARIQVFLVPLYVGIACVLCWGWVLEVNAPLAAPLVLSFIIGLTLTGCFLVMSTLLVDLYPMKPSTATAANNLCRCLMGAAGTAVIIQMVDRMGRGWCFTFIAAVIFFTSPLLWVMMRWGPRWREERHLRVERQKGAAKKGGEESKEKSEGANVKTQPQGPEKQRSNIEVQNPQRI